MASTVSYLERTLQKYVRSDEDFLCILNMALPRLYSLGYWKDLIIQEVQTSTYPYFTLPRYAESVIAIAVDNVPTNLRSIWHDMRIVGVTDKSPATIFGAVDDGLHPVEVDLSSENDYFLTVNPISPYTTLPSEGRVDAEIVTDSGAVKYLSFDLDGSSSYQFLAAEEGNYVRDIRSLSFIDVPRQVEFWAVPSASALYDETLTDSSIALEGNITTPITGDHDFLSITEFSVATPMRLTLTLSVATRSPQTVTLVRDFNLIFSGGTFVLSNLSGPTTGTGAVEANKWRATLNLTSITGDANSVDVDYSVTTSVDTTFLQPYIDISTGLTLASPYDEASQVNVAAGGVLQLWDGDDELNDTNIGTWTPSGSYADPATFAAALEAGWETASGASDVVSVDYISNGEYPIFRVTLTGSAVTHVRGIESSPTTFQPVFIDVEAGTATTCSVAATLEQLEDPSGVETIKVGAGRGTEVARYRRFRINNETNKERTIFMLLKRRFENLLNQDDIVYLDNINALKHSILGTIAEDNADLERANYHWGVCQVLLDQEKDAHRGMVKPTLKIDPTGGSGYPIPNMF